MCVSQFLQVMGSFWVRGADSSELDLELQLGV
jgi:hypothetical protein